MTVDPTLSKLASDLAPESESRDHVGALLRRTREGQKMALSQVAKVLRIRLNYLEAIENGTYERLPAQVYAVGFIRGYADYLGLDGDEAVRRFRREAQGFDAPPDLQFPAPIAERSIPGGRILVIALVLAVCGYGVWYYQAGSGNSQPEPVPQVPTALVHPAEPGADPLASPSEARASVRVAPPGMPPAAQQETKLATAAPPPSAPAATPSSTATTALGTAPLPEPALRSAAAPAETSPSLEAAPPAEQVALLTPPAPPPPKPSIPVQGPGHVYGMTDDPVHIVVRITGDCWIEVREADDSLRFSKLLHAGDEYRVADLAGLTLKTGNSNGLKILVDGKQVNVPPVDSRVYSIALDPARLAAGDAAVPAEVHPVTVPRHPD